MLHWFVSFHISPVFSNSVNINYYSDFQIAIRPYDDAFIHCHRPTVPWQLDCCTRRRVQLIAGDSTHGDALCGAVD